MHRTTTARPFFVARGLAAALAVVLTVLLSGLPHSLAVLVGDGEPPCAADCGGCDEKNSCPPLCTQGACAKVAPSVPTRVVAAGEPPRARAAEAVASSFGDPLFVLFDGISDGVFHPPRA